MDPARFYGKRKSVEVRAIPSYDSDDSELCSSSDEDADCGIDNDYQLSPESSDSEVEGDDIEAPGPSSAEPIIPPQNRSRKLVWKSIAKDQYETVEPIFTGATPQRQPPKPPVNYFRDIIDDDIMSLFVLESNRYSVQCDPAKPLKLTHDELEQFFGMVFLMSIVRMSRARNYWSKSLRYDKIADIMDSTRFEEIKGKLHCNDNLQRPTECHDKLFKVRPFISALRKKFNDIPVSEKLSVDEQVVPFKGKSSLKTYNPKKPKKWGYKIFMCCGVNGLIHDFEVYTGSIQSCPGQPDIGASGNIVLRLLQNVPRNCFHTVYFDNWFTSINLQVTLFKQGIISLGTVRANRLQGCTLPSDKELAKKGRGQSVLRVASSNGVTLLATKWTDNKPVTLLSTYAGISPEGKVKRWDNKQKEYVDICCPSVVLMYNKFMGGVDLLDSLLALYRNPVRSKKWYHRLIFHFLDMSVVQAWSLYRADSKHANLSNKEILSLHDFKVEIASCLIKENKGNGKKRGRPPLELERQIQNKKKRGSVVEVPSLPIRTDNVGHFPLPESSKGRCKIPGCPGYSRTKCMKCNVHLCLTQKSNCFFLFHQP